MIAEFSEFLGCGWTNSWKVFYELVFFLAWFSFRFCLGLCFFLVFNVCSVSHYVSHFKDDVIFGLFKTSEKQDYLLSGGVSESEPVFSLNSQRISAEELFCQETLTKNSRLVQKC